MKCGSSVFKAEGNLSICKITPTKNNCGLMLILGLNLNLIIVIADFTTPGESHLYGLPLSRYRLLRPLGPFFVL